LWVAAVLFAVAQCIALQEHTLGLLRQAYPAFLLLPLVEAQVADGMEEVQAGG
jgi:hypothetical protein